MRLRVIVTVFTLVVLAGSRGGFGQSSAQSVQGSGNRNTATPDLSGVWQRPSPLDYSFTKEPPPMQPWAEEKFLYNVDTRNPKGEGRNELRASYRCAPPGPTAIMLERDPFEIIQSPERVLLLFELSHWIRQIWMNEQHPKEVDPTWMGHSVGRWDGDTLVVDTIKIRDETWLDNAGHVHSDALHVIERFRRPEPNRLEYEITFDDPKAYTKSWTAKRAFNLKPNWRLLEDVLCEEHYLKGTY